MLISIKQALENFCIHQIRLDYTLTDKLIIDKNMLISYIDITSTDNKIYRIYLLANQTFLQLVSQIFLEEDESDFETLKDMLLETTNLIIGSAKVIAQEQNLNNFTISTPHFQENNQLNLSYDNSLSIKIENSILSIAIKELDAK